MGYTVVAIAERNDGRPDERGTFKRREWVVDTK